MTNLDRLYSLLDLDPDNLPTDDELYGLAADHIEALERQLSRVRSFVDDVFHTPSIPFRRSDEISNG